MNKYIVLIKIIITLDLTNSRGGGGGGEERD